MPASDYLMSKILALTLGSTSYSIPTPIYFGLATAVMTSTTTGTTIKTSEPGSSYARVSYTNTGGNSVWVTPTNSSGTVSTNNNATITFPTSTGAWGEIKSIFIADATYAGGGNILWYCNLNPTFTVPNNTSVVFAVHSIFVSLV
jgi:hypothetical protein